MMDLRTSHERQRSKARMMAALLVLVMFEQQRTPGMSAEEAEAKIRRLAGGDEQVVMTCACILMAMKSDKER
jgi:hypothetical protein